jgi:DnaJ-domain-containing protein 1
VAKLREVVPPPTKAGLRDFTAYRLEKEAEQKQWWQGVKENPHRQSEEQRRRWADEQAQELRQQQQELRREWEKMARWWGIPNPFDESCWTVLGLLRTATVEEVKHRYRELVLEHHPDRSGDPEMFKSVQVAYEDAMKRLTPAA